MNVFAILLLLHKSYCIGSIVCRVYLFNLKAYEVIHIIDIIDAFFGYEWVFAVISAMNPLSAIDSCLKSNSRRF